MALSISTIVVGTGVSACGARPEPAAAEALGRARPAELGLPLQSVRWRFGSGFGVGSVLASLPAGVGVGCWFWRVGAAELCLQSSACRARPAAAVGALALRLWFWRRVGAGFVAGVGGVEVPAGVGAGFVTFRIFIVSPKRGPIRAIRALIKAPSLAEDTKF